MGQRTGGRGVTLADVRGQNQYAPRPGGAGRGSIYGGDVACA